MRDTWRKQNGFLKEWITSTDPQSQKGVIGGQFTNMMSLIQMERLRSLIYSLMRSSVSAWNIFLSNLLVKID